MGIDFNKKLFLYLSIGFFLFTIIGTLSHELGHYAFAKSKGYSATISYGFCNWNDSENETYLNFVYKKYPNEIKKQIDFPTGEKFLKILKKQSNNSFWITLGGPLQTMLTGTIGFVMLLGYRNKIYNVEKLNFKQWMILFISLFWCRQIYNFISGFIIYLLRDNYPEGNDEIKLALSLGIPKISISLSTAIIGVIIFVFIFFKVIPKKQRLTFLISGFVGGLFGIYFWLYLVGPIVMP